VLGLLVILLALAPLVVAVLFVPDKYRLTAAVGAAGIMLAVAAYVLGRARSRSLAPFHPRERVASLGHATLGSPLGIASILLLILSVLVVLLPGQFGGQEVGSVKQAKAPKSVKNPVKVVEIPYTFTRDIDGRRWFGTINTSRKALGELNRTDPPPKGYRWVLFYVAVTPLSKDTQFYAASTTLKLVDDQDHLLLPDYGAGIVNADQSYVREKTSPYWTVAYLLPLKRQPKALQVELFPGTDQLLLFRPATRLEFCQQFDEARQAAIKRGDKPRALPADCPGLLRAAKDQGQSAPSATGDAKTGSPQTTNQRGS
jgi:hypothetical protein